MINDMIPARKGRVLLMILAGALSVGMTVLATEIAIADYFKYPSLIQQHPTYFACAVLIGLAISTLFFLVKILPKEYALLLDDSGIELSLFAIKTTHVAWTDIVSVEKVERRITRAPAHKLRWILLKTKSNKDVRIHTQYLHVNHDDLFKGIQGRLANLRA